MGDFNADEWEIIMDKQLDEIDILINNIDKMNHKTNDFSIDVKKFNNCMKILFAIQIYVVFIDPDLKLLIELLKFLDDFEVNDIQNNQLLLNDDLFQID